MPQKPRQYLLVDLLAFVAMSALVVSLFSLSRGEAEFAGRFVSIGIVAIAWWLFRAWRRAPACDECGRRFIAPEDRNALPPICPECGQPQLGRARRRKNLVLGFWAVFALLVVCVLTVIALDPTNAPDGWNFEYGVAFFAIALIMAPLLVLMVGLLLLLGPIAAFSRGKSIPCERCGFIIARGGATDPLLCPRCRLGNLPSKEAQSEVAKGIAAAFAVPSIMAIFVTYMLAGAIGFPVFGWAYWLALLLTLAAMNALFVASLLMIHVVRSRLLTSEPFILKRAAKCAGEKGDVVRSGTTTLWYSGPTNPAPLLMEGMESTRSRLHSITGSEAMQPPFLRVLLFRKRAGFEKFVRPFTAPIPHYARNLSCIYLVQPHRIITICEEDLPFQISHPEANVRMLCGYHFMETLPGYPFANWVQCGISKVLSIHDGDRDGLNRKLAAAVSRGSTLGATLFTTSDREMQKLRKSWDEHASFAKLDQFYAESWSICEYFCGNQAPDGRRDRFRAFLADQGAKAQPAAALERHFGQSVNCIVQSWLDWVQEPGPGTFAPLPPLVEDALFYRVIPLVQNSGGILRDRILAIRNVGSNGLVPAAGALIALLVNDFTLPREEIVWALEAISGLAYGDDAERWTAWWKTLPAEVREKGAPSAPRQSVKERSDALRA
jgi:hypothetical protein